jgi:hypothetical protein
MRSQHLVLAAALLITAISPLAAQSFKSNTSKATNGLFMTETDKFLDVNSWQEVEFDNFFTTFQWDQGISAGLAVDAGPIYLGFGYFGNFWTGTVNSTTEEYGDNYAAQGWRGKNKVTNTANLAWTNRISFLIGMAPMGGILLDFNFNGLGQNNNDKDSLDPNGDKTTNKDSAGLGSFEAGFGWGRNFELGGGLVVKPNLSFHYNIDLTKNEMDSGGVETTTLNGMDHFFSQKDGYSNINDGKVGLTGIITAHAGLGIDLPIYSIWAGYDFETHTYDKQMTNSSDDWVDYSPSYTRSLINIGVGGWYTLDRKLSFSWSLESDFDIENAAVTSEKLKGWLKPEHEFTDSIFAIYPKIAAGVVYKLLPDRFNFNASLALHPLDYSYRKFTHTDSGINPSTITDTSSKINSTYTDTALGFTWFIAPGFSFDAATNFIAGAAKVDLTAFSVLLSYKF